MLITTQKQLRATINEISEATMIGIDTEFTSLDVYASTLLLISLATENQAYVIDMTQLDNTTVFTMLRDIIEDPKILKVGHNLTAEWKQFYHHGKIMMVHMHDTMIADQLINAGLPMRFGLKDVVSRRLGIELDKEIREDFIGWQVGTTFTEEQIEYSKMDAVYPLRVYAQQMQEIADKQLERVYQLEMDDIAPVAMMEYTGQPINKQTLEDMREPFYRFTQQADQAFQDILIGAGVAEEILFSRDGYAVVNSNSPIAVLDMLHRAGINVPSLNSKVVQRWDLANTKKNTKFDNLDYHDLIEDEDVADALDDYKLLNNKVLRAYTFLVGARKLVSTFIEGLIESINPITGRIHAGFKLLGAHRTGRMSSVGPNFQNLPNDLKLELLGLGQYSIRKAIEAKAGRKLIIADFSGIELVILAVLSHDKKLLDQILHGDIHTYVVQEIFGQIMQQRGIESISQENKSKQPWKSFRQGAKRTSYSNAYGTTGKNLSEQLNIDLALIGIKFTAKEGDELIKQWFALFPETAAYLETNAKKAVTDLYVTDAWGRRRNWDRNIVHFSPPRERFWKQLAAGREGKNAPIQGTSATMTKVAIRYLWKSLDMKRARIIITVHDEIIVEAVDSYVDTAKALMKAAMEQSIRDTLPTIADLVGKYETLSVVPKESQRYDK